MLPHCSMLQALSHPQAPGVQGAGLTQCSVHSVCSVLLWEPAIAGSVHMRVLGRGHHQNAGILHITTSTLILRVCVHVCPVAQHTLCPCLDDSLCHVHMSYWERHLAFLCICTYIAMPTAPSFYQAGTPCLNRAPACILLACHTVNLLCLSQPVSSCYTLNLL